MNSEKSKMALKLFAPILFASQIAMELVSTPLPYSDEIKTENKKEIRKQELADNPSGISKKAIEEFKEIYKNKYKQELSNEEALSRACNLLNLYRVVYDSILLEKEW